MYYGEAVKPYSQDLDHGMLTHVLKMQNINDVTNALIPYGLSPMSRKPMIGKDVATVMGFEGGSGINITHATEKYGKKGTLLRRALRIDKKPWPIGETRMRLRITVGHGHTIGNHGFGAPLKTYIRYWRRNENFDETFASGTAPTDEFLESHGFGESTAGISIHMEARGVGPGHPLVQEDENGMSETYSICIIYDPTFSHGYTYMAVNGPPPYLRYLQLPNPQFITHHINFSDGFVAVKYNTPDPLGVVQGVDATVEAVGWDTGFHDNEGWHSGEDGDNYQIPKPNTYEYPNYPIDNPFNPTGEGVG